MALDPFRTGILDELIRQAGIPLVSVSVADINAVPPVVNLTFDNATPEQVTLANQIVANFDWRRRRALHRNSVVAAFQSLNATQRNLVMAHILAEFLRTNVSAANAMASFLDVPISVDEVDPT